MLKTEPSEVYRGSWSST